MLRFSNELPGWILAKDGEHFLLSHGKLVAYSKPYRDDNSGWVDKLKAILGPAQGNDKLFQARYTFAGSACEDADVWYDFNESVVTLDAEWRNDGVTAIKRGRAIKRGGQYIGDAASYHLIPTYEV